MKLRDVVKTKRGYFVDLPCIEKKDDCKLLIEKGSSGKICSIACYENQSEIELEFELAKGIYLRIGKINPSDISIEKPPTE